MGHDSKKGSIFNSEISSALAISKCSRERDRREGSTSRKRKNPHRTMVWGRTGKHFIIPKKPHLAIKPCCTEDSTKDDLLSTGFKKDIKRSFKGLKLEKAGFSTQNSETGLCLTYGRYSTCCLLPRIYAMIQFTVALWGLLSALLP